MISGIYLTRKCVTLPKQRTQKQKKEGGQSTTTTELQQKMDRRPLLCFLFQLQGIFMHKVGCGVGR